MNLLNCQFVHLIILLFSRGDFDEFTEHLKAIQHIYSLSSDRSVAQHALARLLILHRIDKLVSALSLSLSGTLRVGSTLRCDLWSSTWKRVPRFTSESLISAHIAHHISHSSSSFWVTFYTCLVFFSFSQTSVNSVLTSPLGYVIPRTIGELLTSLCAMTW